MSAKYSFRLQSTETCRPLPGKIVIGRDDIETATHVLLKLLASRNTVFWVRGDFDPPGLQFDFNGLWFDASFGVLRF